MSTNDRTDSISQAGILRSSDTLIGSCVVATDGEVGRIRSLLFDDHSWAVSYLVIAAGSWTRRRDVALALPVAERLRWVDNSLGIQCTRDHVFNSPGANSGNWDLLCRSAATQQRTGVLERWRKSGFREESTLLQAPDQSSGKIMSPRFRSTMELLDYCLWSRDKEIGRLHGFLLDENSWQLKYLLVKAENCTYRQSVLVPTRSIESISENDRRVSVNQTGRGL